MGYHKGGDQNYFDWGSSKKRDNMYIPTEKNSHEHTESSKLSDSQESAGPSPEMNVYILIGC